MSFVKSLKCRETDCGETYHIKPQHICEYCFGKLEVDYDYDAIKRNVSRGLIESRPMNMWRYREFLPLEGEPVVGMDVGYTPLLRARNLERALGHSEVYIKNDAVSFWPVIEIM